MIDVETFAKELHEAGRAAVEAGATVNPTGGRFLEWNEISEQAREGRRIQARYLLGKYEITPKRTFAEGYEEGYRKGFQNGMRTKQGKEQISPNQYLSEVEFARLMRDARIEQERMFFAYPVQIIC